MKKEGYFKRLKKPINSVEEGEPILKETKMYFFILLACGVVFSILSQIPHVGTIFTIFGFVFLCVAIYFGYMLYALKRVLKRFENLHCKECNTELGKEDVTWKEINRRWTDENNGSRAEATLHLTIQFVGKCPKCGKTKIFTECLKSGKISASQYSVRDTLVSTQTLVDDYFNNILHI